MRKFKVITDRGAFTVEALNNSAARDKIDAQEKGAFIHEIKDQGLVPVPAPAASVQAPPKGKR